MRPRFSSWVTLVISLASSPPLLRFLDDEAGAVVDDVAVVVVAVVVEGFFSSSPSRLCLRAKVPLVRYCVQQAWQNKRPRNWLQSCPPANVSLLTRFHDPLECSGAGHSGYAQ